MPPRAGEAEAATTVFRGHRAAWRTKRRVGSFPQKARDEFFELAAGGARTEVPALVEDEQRGDAADAPGLGELAFVSVALVVLRPGDLALLDEFLELAAAAILLGFVETDADELDAPILVLGVELRQTGKFGDTRRTGGRPEVDNHDLAPEVGDGNLAIGAQVAE